MLKKLEKTGVGRLTETRVFAAGVAVGLLHAVDDALLHRQPGVPADRHLLALALVTAVALGAVAVFPRIRPGLRGAVALIVGAVTLINGAMHVLQVWAVGPESSDVTGVLAAAAGIALLALGAAIPWRHRAEAHRNPWRRWGNRAIGVVAGAVVAQFFIIPIGFAIVQTHKYREPVGSPPAGFSAVGFDSADGLRLSGWYRPSDNRAAVVIANTSGGDRTGSRRHARLLAAHGYGVLLYDARGTGESEGSPNGWGWEWEHDVAGAIDFLQDQPDVDAQRIGGLGLSTGADVLIEVAATNRDLRAVVSDGATGRSMDDRPPGWLQPLLLWPAFTAGEVFSGTSPGRPLADLAAEVSPTPLLLVAAGSLPGEMWMNQRYADAASEPVELWKLPDARHTNAIDDVPEEYERRVIAHLDAALEPRPR